MNSLSRRFSWYWCSLTFSFISLNAFLITVGWQIRQLSNHNFSVGAFWALIFLPGIFILPIVRRFLESMPTRRLLLGLDGARLLVFLALLISGGQNLFLLFALTAVFGIVATPLYPSIYFCLRKFSEGGLDLRISHWVEVGIQLSVLVGAILGGMVFERYGFTVLATAVFVFQLLALLCLIPFPRWAATSSIESLRMSYMKAFDRKHIAALREKIGARRFAFVCLHVVPQTIVLAINIPLLVFVLQTLKRGPLLVGILDGCFAVGALGTAFLLSTRKNSRTSLVYFLPTTVAASLTFFVFAHATHPMAAAAVCIVLSSLLTLVKMNARFLSLEFVESREMADLQVYFQFISSLLTVGAALLMGLALQYGTVESTFYFLGIILFAFGIFASRLVR